MTLSGQFITYIPPEEIEEINKEGFLDKYLIYVVIYGPGILCILSLILLYKDLRFAFLFVAGYFISTKICYFIKDNVRQLRPKDEAPLIKKEEMYRKKVVSEKYGMPSASMQSMAYSTTFVHLAIGNLNITILYLIVYFISMYERLKYKHHTWQQVTVGSILGAVIGYASYIFGKMMFK
jgi:hypothetical protein